MQVACAWINYLLLDKVIEDYIIRDECGLVVDEPEEREEKLKEILAWLKKIDDYGANLRPRHCILIDKELAQVNGSINRMENWESGYSPLDETYEPGDFNMLSEILNGKS